MGGGEGKISELNEQMESSSSFGKNDPVWLDCLVKKKKQENDVFWFRLVKISLKNKQENAESSSL